MYLVNLLFHTPTRVELLLDAPQSRLKTRGRKWSDDITPDPGDLYIVFENPALIQTEFNSNTMYIIRRALQYCSAILIHILVFSPPILTCRYTAVNMGRVFRNKM